MLNSILLITGAVLVIAIFVQLFIISNQLDRLTDSKKPSIFSPKPKEPELPTGVIHLTDEHELEIERRMKN